MLRSITLNVTLDAYSFKLANVWKVYLYSTLIAAVSAQSIQFDDNIVTNSYKCTANHGDSAKPVLKVSLGDNPHARASVRSSVRQ